MADEDFFESGAFDEFMNNCETELEGHLYKDFEDDTIGAETKADFLHQIEIWILKTSGKMEQVTKFMWDLNAGKYDKFDGDPNE